MAKKKEEVCTVYGREIHNKNEAWKFADEECPIDIKTLRDINMMHNTPMKTKDDFRWFVLFNMLRNISSKLNDSIEQVHLQRIQDNILASAERYLK